MPASSTKPESSADTPTNDHGSLEASESRSREEITKDYLIAAHIFKASIDDLLTVLQSPATSQEPQDFRADWKSLLGLVQNHMKGLMTKGQQSTHTDRNNRIRSIEKLFRRIKPSAEILAAVFPQKSQREILEEKLMNLIEGRDLWATSMRPWRAMQPGPSGPRRAYHTPKDWTEEPSPLHGWYKSLRREIRNAARDRELFTLPVGSLASISSYHQDWTQTMNAPLSEENLIILQRAITEQSFITFSKIEAGRAASTVESEGTDQRRSNLFDTSTAITDHVGGHQPNPFGAIGDRRP